jgi:hypothetical protein
MYVCYESWAERPGFHFVVFVLYLGDYPWTISLTYSVSCAGNHPPFSSVHSGRFCFTNDGIFTNAFGIKSQTYHASRSHFSFG